jgi:hypothetical protein
MNIGGEGSGCNRADHGIGIRITEKDAARFGSRSGKGYDFGSDADRNVPLTYSLNIEITFVNII